ncbi:MAG: hypothetical protein ACXW2T_02875 [Allosphingosinicella sp.]
MRGWSSIVVGLALLALAAWAHLTNLFSGVAITFGIAGAFLIYRGLQGVEVTSAGDPTALGDFISNPAEALVEAAAEQAEGWLTQKRKTAVEDSTDGSGRFDADAALARWMANRPQSPTAAVEVSRPVPGFGRKGL